MADEENNINNNEDNSENLEDTETDDEETEEIEESEIEPEPEENTEVETEQRERRKKKNGKNMDTIAFLREYAKDVNRNYKQVARTLGIVESQALSYLKRYVWLMLHTFGNPRGAQNVANILNESIPERHQISLEEIIRLKPLVKKYGNYEIKKETSEEIAQEYKNNENRYIDSRSLMSNFPEDNNRERINVRGDSRRDYYADMERGGGRGRGDDADYYEDSERSSRPFSSSPRVNLLHWILYKMPSIHYSKIEPFLALFESDEANLWSNPVKLQQLMLNCFGDGNGGLAFDRLQAEVKNQFPPAQQLGSNPYLPNQNINNNGYQVAQPINPQMNQYVAAGIIPAGIDANSPFGQMLIQDHFRKRQLDEEDARFSRRINQMMQMNMNQFFSGGGNGNMKNGQPDITGLVSSGLATATPILDEKTGQYTYRIEPNSNRNNNNNNSNMNPLDTIRTVIDLIKPMIQTNNNNPENEIVKSILPAIINNTVNKNPFDDLMNVKKLLDTLSPTNAPPFNVEAGKLELEREKIRTDKEFALRAAEREEKRFMWEREHEIMQEQESKKSVGKITEAIFGLGNAFIPIIPMLLSMRNGGGANAGGANPLGMIGQALGGMMGGQGGNNPLAGMMGGGNDNSNPLAGLMGQLGGMFGGGANNMMGGMGAPTMNPFDMGGGMGGITPPNMRFPTAPPAQIDMNNRYGVPFTQPNTLDSLREQQELAARERENSRFYAPPSDLFGDTPPVSPVISNPSVINPNSAGITGDTRSIGDNQYMCDNVYPSDNRNGMIIGDNNRYYNSDNRTAAINSDKNTQTLKIYSAEDFADMTPEELDMYERKASELMASADSLNSAVTKAKIAKRYTLSQSPNSKVIERPIPNPQPFSDSDTEEEIDEQEDFEDEGDEEEDVSLSQSPNNNQVHEKKQVKTTTTTTYEKTEPTDGDAPAEDGNIV